MSLIIDKYQISIFPKDFYVSDLNSLLADLSVMPEFNGEKYIIPIPSDAPREIPRMTLQSNDKTIGCDISFDSFMIAWKNIEQEENFQITEATVTDFVSRFLTIVLKEKLVNRIGFILRFYDNSKNPSEDIAKNIFVGGISNNLTNFQVKLVYRKKLGSKNVNDLISVGMGDVLEGKNKGRVLVFENDVNTLAESSSTLNFENISEFIKDAYSNNYADTKSVYSKIFIDKSE